MAWYSVKAQGGTDLSFTFSSLILCSYLQLDLSIGPMRATCPAHLIFLDLITLIILFDEE
jgi:hypothetical protein